MNDLVTGGAGFLGFYLARTLSEQGRKVTIVDNFVRSTSDPLWDKLLARDNVTFIRGDLCDTDFVNGLPDMDCVFHLAAFNGTQNFYSQPIEVMRHSTIPAMNLVDRYMVKSRVSFFAYTGSSESYAGAISNNITTIPTPENTPLVIDDVTNPRWSYAVGKLHGEVVTAVAGNHCKIPWQIWRVHNCFGPRMGSKHVMSDFIERASRDVFELYGYKDTRTFLYVEDAIRIMMGLRVNPNAHGEIINVGGINEIMILDLAKKIMKQMGRSGKIELYPPPRGSINRRLPDTTKLQSLLKEFRYSNFTESLQITVESLLEEIKSGGHSEK